MQKQQYYEKEQSVLIPDQQKKKRKSKKKQEISKQRAAIHQFDLRVYDQLYEEYLQELEYPEQEELDQILESEDIDCKTQKYSASRIILGTGERFDEISTISGADVVRERDMVEQGYESDDSFLAKTYNCIGNVPYLRKNPEAAKKFLGHVLPQYNTQKLYQQVIENWDSDPTIYYSTQLNGTHGRN